MKLSISQISTIILVSFTFSQALLDESEGISTSLKDSLDMDLSEMRTRSLTSSRSYLKDSISSSLSASEDDIFTGSVAFVEAQKVEAVAQALTSSLMSLKNSFENSRDLEELQAKLSEFQTLKTQVDEAWNKVEKLAGFAYNAFKEESSEIPHDFVAFIEKGLREMHAAKAIELSLVDLYEVPFIQAEQVIQILKKFNLEADDTLKAYMDYDKQKKAISNPSEDLGKLQLLYESIEVEPKNFRAFDMFVEARERAKASWSKMEESIKTAKASFKEYMKLANSSGSKFWKDQVLRDKHALRDLEEQIKEDAEPLYDYYVAQDPAQLILRLLRADEAHRIHRTERDGFINAVLAVESLYGSMQAEYKHINDLKMAVNDANTNSLREKVKLFMWEKYRLLGRLAMFSDLNDRLEEAKNRLQDYRIVTKSGGMWGVLEQVDEVRYTTVRDQIGAVEEKIQGLLVLNTLAIPTIQQLFLETREQKNRMLQSTTAGELIVKAKRFARVSAELILAHNATIKAINESRNSPEYLQLTEDQVGALKQKEDSLSASLSDIIKTELSVADEDVPFIEDASAELWAEFWNIVEYEDSQDD